MDWFLGGAALLFFLAGHPASALLMRCALAASQRFSPRAALALSAVSALSGAAAGLLCRGGLRAVPKTQASVSLWAGFIGGTLGRAALLMLSARAASSLTLARVQMIPLLLLALLSLLPTHVLGLRVTSSSQLFGFSLLCAAADGFLGAGGMPLFALAGQPGVQRRYGAPSCALLMSAAAQTGAILLTLLCGQAQVFPSRMLVFLALGSALGTVIAEKQKERGALHRGMRAALKVYLVLSALACIEQAA